MATHSSILAWRIPWTEQPGELQPRGVEENEERFCPKPGGALANRPWKEAVRIVPRTAKGIHSLMDIWLFLPLAIVNSVEHLCTNI